MSGRKESRVDALIAEHRKLRSSTLNYPAEQELIALARELEAENARLRAEDTFEAGINLGIIYALLVLVNDGQESLAWEILKGCDDKAIRRIAKQEGDEAIVKLVDDFRRSNRESAKFWNKRSRKARKQKKCRPYLLSCSTFGGRSPKTGKKVGARYRWSGPKWGEGRCTYCGRSLEEVLRRN